MIVVMEPDVPEAAVEAVLSHLTRAHFDVHRSSGQRRTIVGVVGDVTDDHIAAVREFEGVAEVVRVTEPYRLASRKFRQRSTAIEGDFGRIGAGELWIALEAVGLAPETDAPPPSYALLAGRPFDASVTRSVRARERVGGLACLSVNPRAESPRFPLVFVAREPSWGVDRWLQAAERELVRGGTSVVLFEQGTEFPSGERTLDAMAIAHAKARSHLPIVVDVPTIALRRRYCGAVALAALGAGADGVVLRVFVGDESDRQSHPATLPWDEAVALGEQLRAVSRAMQL
jgi:3-deoxy-7-phosphoheptulonate synthase